MVGRENRTSADWISERVGSEPDGSEILAYYFEMFFDDPEAIANASRSALHRESLNLVAEVLQFQL